jgi:hypothetical protein
MILQAFDISHVSVDLNEGHKMLEKYLFGCLNTLTIQEYGTYNGFHYISKNFEAVFM